MLQRPNVRAEGLHSDSPLLDLATIHPKVKAVLDEAPTPRRRRSILGRSRRSAPSTSLRTRCAGPDKIIAKDPEDPKGGAQIRIERIREITKTVAGIHGRRSRGSIEELATVNCGFPGTPTKVRRCHRQASETKALLKRAEAGLKILPRFLGADGPRTYLFGMQNSAEQRGTGGAMLQFALLSINDGRPELSKEASTVYDVDEDRTPISIPLPTGCLVCRRHPRRATVR